MAGVATAPEPGRIVLVRHGETEWSASGQHTSFTDLPLLDSGRHHAEALARPLTQFRFGLVLTSPMRRAIDTCKLAGLGDRADVEPNLSEWGYGDYEGVTTAEIRKTVPGWRVFSHAIPGGETPEEVGDRADAVIARCSPVVERGDDAVLFGHGHMSRVIAARWLGLHATCMRYFVLSAGSLSVLWHERETNVIERWNHQPTPA